MNTQNHIGHKGNLVSDTMKYRITGAIIALSILLMVFDACVQDDPLQGSTVNNVAINLKWNKGYEQETPQQAEIGLIWGLSYLGAEWPLSSYHKAVQWQQGYVIQLNLEYAGFSEQALLAFRQIIHQLVSSEEYKKTGAIDLGRFIMLTLNSSNHYYKITGAVKRFSDYKVQYEYNAVKGAIIESAISTGHRELWLPAGDAVRKWSFVSREGLGRIDSGTFLTKEFEMFDVMSNGQLRFNIFDAEGNQLTAAHKSYSDAGKPAKCLWCHEGVIQPAFDAKTSVPGFYSVDSFALFVKEKQKLLNEFRLGLYTKLDYTAKQEHTLLELLYISFSEPSAERLSLEWGMPVEVVKQRLAGLATHQHAEFPFLGDLYNRHEVDQIAPYSSVRVPTSAREESAYEPDLIH